MDLNITTNSCIDNFNYNNALHISNILWYVSGFISVLIGIPGHIFQIIIFSNKTNRKEPTSLYLMAIAICELIFLLGLFWLWCANMSLIKTDPREVLSCGIFYSILIGSTTLSNLYLASMSIDRSIMILNPSRYRSLITRCHVKCSIIVILIIILLLVIPHHFYLYYDSKVTLFLCEFYPSVNPRPIRLWSFIHAIFFVSIPLLIVCISSFILLQNRYKHQQKYKNTSSINAHRMYRRSIFIFFLSVGVLISVVPYSIFEIFMVHSRFFGHMTCMKRSNIYKILLSCFLTLSSINYSMKFYIHLIISTSFRQNFIAFICCKSNQNTSRTTRLNNEQSLRPLRNQDKTIDIK